jgi:hypothetical protein
VFRSAVTVGILVATTAATLTAARAYQIPNARRFVTAYDHAPATIIEPTAIPLRDGSVRLAVDLFRPTASRADVDEVLLKAEFDSQRAATPRQSIPCSATTSPTRFSRRLHA